MSRLTLLAMPVLIALLPAAALAGWGHHHRYQYYQSGPVYGAPVYAAPMVYAAPPAAAPSSLLADILLQNLLERFRDNLSGGNNSGSSNPPATDSSVRAELQQLQAELAAFRKEQSGANESLGTTQVRQGQELATVRADLEAMKTKLDAIIAATGSGSTLQDAIANMNKRFPQRSKTEIRTTLLDELNKKIKAQSKLTAAEQQALIDGLTKDFDAQLDAAFPSWKE